MAIFKKKIFAILMAVLIVVASTLVSCNIKLTKEFRKVTDGFYTGVLVDGKRDTSIHSQLLIIGKEAGTLASIAERNGLDAGDFKSDAEYFSRDVVTMEDDISYIYFCYQELLDDVMNTGYSLTSIALSQSEEAAAAGSLEAIIKAQAVIDSSAYNDSVRTYLSNLHFLTEFLANISGVSLPEYFA